MRKLLLLLACGSVFYACADSFDHDHKLAAKRAEAFAQVAFVRQDFENGYAMLSDSGRRYVPLEKFKETIVKSHPRSYPTKVAATDYEPMTGEKAIYFYLTGDNGGEHFYYTLILDGTAATDYKVTRFSRGSGPFGSSNTRQPLRN